MLDPLDSFSINNAIEDTMFAGKLRLFPSLPSTNTLAMQEGDAGAEHGSVYLADEQTAGEAVAIMIGIRNRQREST